MRGNSRLALLMSLGMTLGMSDHMIDGRQQRTERAGEVPLAVTPLNANTPRTTRKLTRAKRKAAKAGSR